MARHEQVDCVDAEGAELSEDPRPAAGIDERGLPTLANENSVGLADI